MDCETAGAGIVPGSIDSLDDERRLVTPTTGDLRGGSSADESLVDVLQGQLGVGEDSEEPILAENEQFPNGEGGEEEGAEEEESGRQQPEQDGAGPVQLPSGQFGER